MNKKIFDCSGKELSFIKREFQEQKALCLFISIYNKDLNIFSSADYTLHQVATMFNEKLVSDRMKDKLLKGTDIEDLIQTDFDLIVLLFDLTDKAYRGCKESKEWAELLVSAIDIKEIPQRVRTYVFTEMMLNSGAKAPIPMKEG